MPQRRALLAALPLLALEGARATVHAPPPELLQQLPGAQLQGQGRFRFLGLAVYDARLWTSSPALPSDWAASPLALELAYARSFTGTQIAERSLQEMRRVGDIPEARGAQWLAQMKTLFPDVKEGDRIMGLHLPGVVARFFVNGQLRGDLRDETFARLFFGIWLSDKTPEPALRDALLGKPR